MKFFTRLPRRATRPAFFVVCTLFLTTFLSLLRADSSPVESPYPSPPFFPPAGHPRIYLTEKILPRLREDVLKAQNARAWATHLENLDHGTDGNLLPPKNAATGNMSSSVLSIIESLAFDYVLRGNADEGHKAVAALRQYLATVAYPVKDYNNTGQTVFTIGLVYDWCYPLLNDADRKFFIAAGLETAAKMETGWPPIKQGNVTGHGPEAQIQRDLMSLALAIYDERPDIYQIVAGRFFDRFVAAKKFMYPAHMYPQGSHYANYRFQWEMLGTWIFDRLGLPQVYGPEQHFAMYWTLYARRPDGQLLRDGDTHSNNLPLGTYYSEPSRPMFLAANYFNDPYLKKEAIRMRPELAPSSPRGNQSLNCVELLVFNNPDLAGRPLSELPLTKYFPSPKGGMIARTSWAEGKNSPAVVAEFKINEWYFANHQHLDAGAFQIYYHGMLATDSGYYQAAVDKTDTPLNEGSSGYGSLYDVNYHKRSIAHNTLCVLDPDEVFFSNRWKTFPMANDGGQRFPNNWDEPKEHETMLDPANRYRIGEVLGHSSDPDSLAPDYSYLKGDLTQAYSAKIKAFERSFVFLNLKQASHPAALVVFDRVTATNPAFKKIWLLHGLEEPTIRGNQTVFADTRAGYTGKLTVDTVLPLASDTQIEKVGGLGRENWVDGVNYKVLLRPEGCNEGGGWRIEVSPKQARNTDYFLHVLQMGDHTPDTPPLVPQRIETATHAGIRIADRVVLFAKTRDRTTAPVEFAFEGDGMNQIMVADLSAGKWIVKTDTVPAREIEVGAEEGMAFFIGSAGHYRLSRLTP